MIRKDPTAPGGRAPRPRPVRLSPGHASSPLLTCCPRGWDLGAGGGKSRGSPGRGSVHPPAGTWGHLRIGPALSGLEAQQNIQALGVAPPALPLAPEQKATAPPGRRGGRGSQLRGTDPIPRLPPAPAQVPLHHQPDHRHLRRPRLRPAPGEGAPGLCPGLSMTGASWQVQEVHVSPPREQPREVEIREMPGLGAAQGRRPRKSR